MEETMNPAQQEAMRQAEEAVAKAQEEAKKMVKEQQTQKPGGLCVCFLGINQSAYASSAAGSTARKLSRSSTRKALM